MLDVFNIAQPPNCNIQIFYGDGSAGGTVKKSWMKPRGVSHVYILLIGSGGNGDGSSTGGGSGAVTVWYGAAQNVPDYLGINVSIGSATQIRGQFSNSNPVTLLSANTGSNGGPGGAAMTANYFTAMGFFQSVAGQNGTTGAVNASSTTFLAGGGAGGNDQTSNYGYVTRTDVNKNGFLLMQPIIVGMGGMGTGRGGIGSGGGVTGTGGPGMVLIASW